MSETKPSVGANHRNNNQNAGGTSYSANTFLSSSNSKPLAPTTAAVTELPPK